MPIGLCAGLRVPITTGGNLEIVFFVGLPLQCHAARTVHNTFTLRGREVAYNHQKFYPKYPVTFDKNFIAGSGGQTSEGVGGDP